MHSYINFSRLKDFNKSKDFGDIWDDVQYRYEVRNIIDDEGRYYIIQALYDDYRLQRANYEAYIEKGMNARILMELRKSAIIPLADKHADFYTKHKNCNTVQDIKELRTAYLKFVNTDYIDKDWQYYYMIKYTLGKKAKDIFIDYEDCYGDGDISKQTTVDDYAQDFVDDHLIGYIDLKAIREEKQKREDEYVKQYAEDLIKELKNKA